MKLIEFVPPRPHRLWKLCLQMGITELVVAFSDADARSGEELMLNFAQLKPYPE